MTPGRERAGPLGRRRARTAWLFLAPTLVALGMVGLWPLARTVWLSLTDARLGDAAQASFVGLANYRLLLGDGEWWNAVWNTLIFAASSVAIETVLGVVFALVMNARFRGRGLVRAAILVPWAIPLVVSGKMWAWMYNDLYGVINAALLGLGVIAQPVAWLADANLAMGAVIATDVWKTTPFMALLILAALQMVPKDVYEAARLDGVSPVVVFFRITLPLIRPVLLVAIIFRSLDALQDLRSHLRHDQQQPADRDHVDLRPPRTGRVRRRRLRLGGLGADLPHRRAVHPGLPAVRRPAAGGGRAMTRLAKAFGLYLLVVLIVGYTLFPFFWAVVSSLKSGSAIFDAALIPDQPTLQNYLAIFAEQPFGRTILNSLIVGAGTVALSLLLAIGAAYALGRVSFRGRGLLLMVILAVSMFPQVAVLSGMFELITALGLYDSHGALILSYLVFTLPFTAWVLTTFMRDLPRELEEAAMVDGAGPFTIVTRIFLPLDGPGDRQHDAARLPRRLERVPVRAHLHADRGDPDRAGGHRADQRRLPVRGAVGPVDGRLGDRDRADDRAGPRVPAQDRLRAHRRGGEGIGAKPWALSCFAGWPSASARSRCCATSTWRSPRALSPWSSGRPAAASRRCSASSPGWRRRAGARSRSPGAT